MITILHEQRVTTHQPVCDADTTIDTNDDAAALWLDAPVGRDNDPVRRIAASELLLVLTCCLT